MDSTNLDCELRNALEIKHKLLQIKDVLKDNEAYPLQVKLQLTLKSIILQDLEFALNHKVEQELWNYGIKHYITALQNIVKDKKNPQRKQKQFELGYCLNAANGFYIILLEEIVEEYDLNLPFIRRFPLLAPEPKINSNRPKPPSNRSCNNFCHLVLLRMGDLARYRNQPFEAELHYKHAIELCPSSGQPFNQLALLGANRAESFISLYNYIRSISAPIRFPPAISNLEKLFKSTLITYPTDPEKRCLTTQDFRATFIKAHALIYFRKDLPRASKLMHLLSFYVGRHMHKSKNKLSNEEVLQILIINLYALGRTSVYLDALPEPQITERVGSPPSTELNKSVNLSKESLNNKETNSSKHPSAKLSCVKHTLECSKMKILQQKSDNTKTTKLETAKQGKIENSLNTQKTVKALKTILKPSSISRQLSDLTISKTLNKSSVTFSPGALKKTSSVEDIVKKVKSEYPFIKSNLSISIKAEETISQGSLQLPNEEESLDNILTSKISNDSNEDTRMKENNHRATFDANKELNKVDQQIKSDVLHFLASQFAACLCRINSKQAAEVLITYPELAAVKLILEWIREHPRILCDRSFIQRPALWPILAILLNKLQSFIQKAENKPDIYNCFPLPEDRMLLGCIPFDKPFSKLKFDLFTHLVKKDTWHLIRAMRILELGIWLAEVAPYKVLTRRCVTPTIENPCGVVFQPTMTSTEILAKGNFVKIDQLPGLFAKGVLIDKNIKEYVALKLNKLSVKKQSESSTPTPMIIEKPVPVETKPKQQQPQPQPQPQPIKQIKNKNENKDFVPLTTAGGAIRKNYPKNKKDGYNRQNNHFNSFNKITRPGFNHHNHHQNYNSTGENRHPHHNHHNNHHNHQQRNHQYLKPANNKPQQNFHQPRYPMRFHSTRAAGNFTKPEVKAPPPKPDIAPVLILTHSPKLEIKDQYKKNANLLNNDQEYKNATTENTKPKIILSSKNISRPDSQSKTGNTEKETERQEKEQKIIANHIKQPINTVNHVKINIGTFLPSNIANHGKTNTGPSKATNNVKTNLGAFLKPTTLAKHDFKKTIRKTQNHPMEEVEMPMATPPPKKQEMKVEEVKPESSKPSHLSSPCVSWWTQDSTEWPTVLGNRPPLPLSPVAATYSLFNPPNNDQDKTDLGASFNNASGFSSQSLWSGPGPSPLERLLQQQRQQREAGT